MDLKRMQRELMVISGAYRNVGGVYPSGKYDEVTKRAVREVRSLMGSRDCPEDMLVSELARRIVTESTPCKPDIFQRGRVYAPGDRADAVAVCQIMINRIAARYLNVPTLSVNGTMDAATVRAIGILGGIFGHNGSQLDTAFWRELCALYALVIGRS